MTFDHTRRACYFGYITQAIVNNIAPLLFIVFQTRYGISYEMLGRLVLLNFGTQLLTDCAAIPLMSHVGYRVPLVVAHFLCVSGLALLGVLPLWMSEPYSGLCVAIVIYAIGGGLLEVLISPVVDGLPTPEASKAAQMSLLHSFYCWGQVGVVVGTTLLLALLGSASWWMLPLFWALLPLANGVLFSRVPMPPKVSEAQRTPLRELLRSPAFCLSMALMLGAGASELTMSQWSSLLAEQGLGLPKVWGDLAGPCLFAVLMGIGRVVYGLRGEKIALIPALLVCGSGATVCYLLAALAPSPALNLLGCAGCGLFVSLLWPGTFSLASARFPLGGTAMFGVLAVFGDLGAAGGPWIAGAIADASARGANVWSLLLPLTGQSSLRAGLLVATLFPITIIITALIYRSATRQTHARM